ncbi:MAG: hypothetical protein IKU71_03150 [Kiritimatiellae bacterium]|nr:hypothetical protein [Kiritimatiellia bacterium]
MDEHRAENGHSTAIVLERDACRAGASVFVGCSFCVRSRPVWRSSCVGSCGVRARRQIARRLTGGSQRRRIVEVKPKAADSPRAGHGLATDGTRACLRTSDGRITGGHWSDLDESSYPKMGGGARWTWHGRETDTPRATHGLETGGTRTIPLRTDNGRQTDRQRTSDGRRTGGHSSVADILRHSEMGGGMADLRRAYYGRAMGGTRTGNGRRARGDRLTTGF